MSVFKFFAKLQYQMHKMHKKKMHKKKMYKNKINNVKKSSALLSIRKCVGVPTCASIHKYISNRIWIMYEWNWVFKATIIQRVGDKKIIYSAIIIEKVNVFAFKRNVRGILYRLLDNPLSCVPSHFLSLICTSTHCSSP